MAKPDETEVVGKVELEITSKGMENVAQLEERYPGRKTELLSIAMHIGLEKMGSSTI